MARKPVKHTHHNPDPGEEDGFGYDMVRLPQAPKPPSAADTATDMLAGNDPNEDQLSKIARLAGSGH